MPGVRLEAQFQSICRKIQLAEASASLRAFLTSWKQGKISGKVNRLLATFLVSVVPALLASVVPTFLVSCFASHNYCNIEAIERWPALQSTHRLTLRPWKDR